MRMTGLAPVLTGVAMALALSVAPRPAEAGQVCNRVDLSSPCVSSSDVEPSIRLGGSGDQGRLRVRNADNEIAVELRGSNANVTNLFSNSASRSNGLVKAWARINADGTVESCWRCNKDEEATRREEEGVYHVDFTPLATSIRGRPRLAIADRIVGFTDLGTIVEVANVGGNLSAVRVAVRDIVTNDNDDQPFVVVIF